MQGALRAAEKEQLPHTNMLLHGIEDPKMPRLCRPRLHPRIQSPSSLAPARARSAYQRNDLAAAGEQEPPHGGR
jgi:hypothetical protein